MCNHHPRSARIRGLFGCSLKDVKATTSSGVPIVLADAIKWIATRALSQPGVFTDCYNEDTVLRVKTLYDRGAPQPLQHLDSAAEVGAVLKIWLMELEEPLIPTQLQIKLISLESPSIDLLQNIIQEMDATSWGALRALLLFLQQYCLRQHPYEQHLEKVAMAFTPVLLPWASTRGCAKKAHWLVQTLIAHALKVFPMGFAHHSTLSQQEVAASIPAAATTPLASSFDAAVDIRIGTAKKPSLTVVVPEPPSEPPLGEEVDDEEEDADADVWRSEPEFVATMDTLVTVTVTSSLFDSDDDDEEISKDVTHDRKQTETRRPVLVHAVAGHCTIEPDTANDADASVICVVRSPSPNKHVSGAAATSAAQRSSSTSPPHTELHHMAVTSCLQRPRPAAVMDTPHPSNCIVSSFPPLPMHLLGQIHATSTSPGGVDLAAVIEVGRCRATVAAEPGAALPM